MSDTKPVTPPWKAPGGGPAGKYAYTPNRENFASTEFAWLGLLVVIVSVMGICLVLAYSVFRALGLG